MTQKLLRSLYYKSSGMSLDPESYINQVIDTYMKLYPNIFTRRPDKIVYLDDTLIISPTGNPVLGITVKTRLPRQNCSRCLLSTSTYNQMIIPYYGLNEETIVHELIHTNGVRSEVITRIMTRVLLGTKNLAKRIREVR